MNCHNIRVVFFFFLWVRLFEADFEQGSGFRVLGSLPLIFLTLDPVAVPASEQQ